MPGTFLERSSLTLSAPSFLNGKAVVAWYGHIREDLLKTGPDLANFLAQPLVRRDQGSIDWHAALEGEPVRVSLLPPQEREAAQAKALALRQAILSRAQALSASGSPDDRLLGTFMAEAMAHPEAQELFVVGGSVVSALWGHEAGLPPPPPPPAPPPPPPRRRPPSAKGLLLLTATGVLAGIILVLAAAFLILPEALYPLAYLFGGQGPVAADAAREAQARGDLYDRRLAYLKDRGSCLVIPGGSPGAPYAFLEGCWELQGQGFLNSETGEAVKLSFCYKSGTAEIVLKGPGVPGGECKAGAQAALTGRGLSVSSGSEPSCQGGRTFPPISISCEPGKPEGASARCALRERNWEGSDFKDIPVSIRK
jgi:hypothetical protein